METKTCKECGLQLPATTEFFYKAKFTTDSLNGKCKDCIKKYTKKHRVNYKAKNKEKIAEAKKEYCKNNKDKVKSWNTKYRQSNKLKLNIKARIYYKSERGREINNINWHRKIARKMRLDVSFSIEDWKICKAYFNNSCAYCGDEASKLQYEHFIPLSKEGGFTKENILPSCQRCNLSKKNNDFYEWYPKQKFYSVERIRLIENYIISKK